MHFRFQKALLAALALLAAAPARSQAVPDSLAARTLREAFEKGRFKGQFRSFFMATDNFRSDFDAFALAAGGGLEFASRPFKGFSIGAGGVYNFNLWSSDLAARDSATGAANRYEIGLFDIENPKNRNDLDRLNALWLRWQRRGAQLTVGKMAVETPFINPQDSRMRPTAVEGAWGRFRFSKKHALEGGWLWAISPRSTVRWVSMGESIGLYPQGLNPDGTPSGYLQHLTSRGTAVIGWRAEWGRGWRTQAWSQTIENISQTFFAQVDFERKAGQGRAIVFAGLQALRQNALADGGNPDPDKTYFEKGARSAVFSAQTGLRRGSWRVALAATRSTAAGRFLSPREWGREPFYTFMSRERIEGAGDVWAATLRADWKNASKRLEIGLAAGHFELPDVQKTALNKYAFPSFHHVNAEARYAFGGALSGLRGQLLWVWKSRAGEIHGRERLRLNRVDMQQWNAVLNYSF